LLTLSPTKIHPRVGCSWASWCAGGRWRWQGVRRHVRACVCARTLAHSSAVVAV